MMTRLSMRHQSETGRSARARNRAAASASLSNLPYASPPSCGAPPAYTPSFLSTQSPDDSPPSSGNIRQGRLDLLSPEHAMRPLPTPTMESFVSHNKRQQRQEEHPHMPLSEFADLPPGFVPASLGPGSSTDKLRHPTNRAHARGAPRYEAAPVPDGVEYPQSPLQDMARAQIVTTKAAAEQMRDVEAPLSPLSISPGLFGLKNRLPWRRNTTK